MHTVDLNCDLGEGCPNDAELMRYISSANIACGFHAGDAATMRRTAELAVANSVAVGAHPGYRDRENFGRTQMALSREEVVELVREQITAMREICDEFGAALHHVKPHGALYNQAAKDRELAAAIAEAVASLDDGLVLYGLSGSFLISEADAAGLRTASEVFADRTYQPDGTLTPRTESNALIADVSQSIEQVLRMIESGTVVATTGETVPIVADTVCLHGDGEHAIEFARAIREALSGAGIGISSPVIS
jgi:UPF0271 protein